MSKKEPDKGYSPVDEPEAGPVQNTEGLSPERAKQIREHLFKKYRVYNGGELAEMKIDPQMTLLGADRLLCVGGIGFLVAPTGVGKSSAVRHMACNWAVKKPAFGIPAMFHLRVLIIQAENDRGDETEMVRDIWKLFKPSEQAVIRKGVYVVRVNDVVGPDFIYLLKLFLAEYKPDLVILDPMNSYTGGDPSDPKIITPFLRNMVIPALEQFDAGLLMVHHTPKTRNWDTSKWKQHDWAYAASGSNEISNVARFMLVIDPSDKPGLYVFRAAKRGARIGWKNAIGDPDYIRAFRHDRKHGVMLWTAASEDELEHVRRLDKEGKLGRKLKYPTPLLLKPLLTSRDEGGLTRQQLAEKLKLSGCAISQTTLYERLDAELAAGTIECDDRNIYTITMTGLDLFK